ncbi:acyl-CoA thioesterase [Halobacterium yunchengense]|uniref:acyl-CoA thioesterase n=1 Tax=Halobacterium yunchengense TaxID=3108497 RepID=UPI00300AC0B5
MSAYTYEIELEPQYRDLDPNGHVNQAVYSSYCEQARAKYWEDVIGQRHDRAELALVKLELEYSAEILLGETVTVRQRIGELGESSIPIEYELSTDGETAATGSVVLLSYDREAREPAPIPQEWRDAIVEYEGHDAE